MKTTTVFTEIDFSTPGKQIGTLALPCSRHDDAWGVIPFPIAVIGDASQGPTVFLTAGIHGDEYEGPVVLNDLIRDLCFGDLAGRLILMPCANVPALRVGCRVSPLDGLNLARVFPGNHGGSPTEQIAAYIYDCIFPISDYYIDLHSGGSSLFIEPCAQIVLSPGTTADLRLACHRLATWFGAKWTVLTTNMGDTRTSCGAAVSLGIPCIAAEMGANGGISPKGVADTRQAVQRVLAHLGVLRHSAAETPPATRHVAAAPPQENLWSPSDGFFEPFFGLGDAVCKDQPAGRLHRLDDPSHSPRELCFRADGVVQAMRTFGRVRAGSSLAVLVRDVEAV